MSDSNTSSSGPGRCARLQPPGQLLRRRRRASSTNGQDISGVRPRAPPHCLGTFFSAVPPARAFAGLRPLCALSARSLACSPRTHTTTGRFSRAVWLAGRWPSTTPTTPLRPRPSLRLRGPQSASRARCTFMAWPAEAASRAAREPRLRPGGRQRWLRRRWGWP